VSHRNLPAAGAVLKFAVVATESQTVETLDNSNNAYDKFDQRGIRLVDAM